MLRWTVDLPAASCCFNFPTIELVLLEVRGELEIFSEPVISQPLNRCYWKSEENLGGCSRGLVILQGNQALFPAIKVQKSQVDL